MSSELYEKMPVESGQQYMQISSKTKKNVITYKGIDSGMFKISIFEISGK